MFYSGCIKMNLESHENPHTDESLHLAEGKIQDVKGVEKIIDDEHIISSEAADELLEGLWGPEKVSKGPVYLHKMKEFISKMHGKELQVGDKEVMTWFDKDDKNYLTATHSKKEIAGTEVEMLKLVVHDSLENNDEGLTRTFVNYTDVVKIAGLDESKFQVFENDGRDHVTNENKYGTLIYSSNKSDRKHYAHDLGTDISFMKEHEAEPEDIASMLESISGETEKAVKITNAQEIDENIALGSQDVAEKFESDVVLKLLKYLGKNGSLPDGSRFSFTFDDSTFASHSFYVHIYDRESDETVKIKLHENMAGKVSYSSKLTNKNAVEDTDYFAKSLDDAYTVGGIDPISFDASYGTQEKLKHRNMLIQNISQEIK